MIKFSMIVISKSYLHLPKNIRINHRQVNAPVGPLSQVKFTQGNSRLMIKFSLIVISKSYLHLPKKY